MEAFFYILFFDCLRIFNAQKSNDIHKRFLVFLEENE